MKEENDMKEKIKFFMDEQIEVHIKKHDGYFWNGYIIEQKNDNVYLIKERKLGILHLFIKDIRSIEECRSAK